MLVLKIATSGPSKLDLGGEDLSRPEIWIYWLSLFNGLFSPTFNSQTSQLFRYSESLGKSNGKKWFQIWTLLLKNGVKSPRRKNLFTFFFFHLFTPFKRLFVPISRSPMSKLFWYSESLKKSNGKKWSQIWTFLLKNGVKLPLRKKSFFLLRILPF